MKLKKIWVGILFLLYLSSSLYSNEAMKDEYMFALDSFKEARYEQSIKLLLAVLGDADSRSLHGDAAYWISRAHLEGGDLDNSSRFLEEFLLNYPSHPHNMDGRYYKGRILFLEEEYDNAIHYFSSYLTSFPDSPYYASSLFWIAESLYFLGRFDEAGEMYRSLLEDFPRSVKTEASRYKLSLIEYRYREEELLKLLQWSHEEFLKSSGEYEQREEEFNQALSIYRNKLVELSRTKENFDNKMKLLELKANALSLKEALLSSQSGRTSGE